MYVTEITMEKKAFFAISSDNLLFRAQFFFKKNESDFSPWPVGVPIRGGVSVCPSSSASSRLPLGQGSPGLHRAL